MADRAETILTYLIGPRSLIKGGRIVATRTQLITPNRIAGPAYFYRNMPPVLSPYATDTFSGLSETPDIRRVNRWYRHRVTGGGLKHQMATRNIVFGSTNSDKEIDVIDIVALIALPNVASILFEVFSFEVNVFGGYDFTEPLWTMFGADISLALLVALFSLLWIAGTNLANRQTDMGQWEFGVLVTALALPVLHVLVPSVANLVMYHDLSQVAATLYVAIAAIYVSYAG